MKISAQNSIRYSLFSPNLDHWECRNHRNSVRWTSSWHSIALLHPLEGRGRQDGACILHCPSNSSHDRMLLVSCPFVPVRWWADLVICSFQFKKYSASFMVFRLSSVQLNGRIGPWECTATEQGDNAAAIQTRLLGVKNMYEKAPYFWTGQMYEHVCARWVWIHLFTSTSKGITIY